MRQYRTSSIAQAYAYTPKISMTAQRVSRCVSCVLGLALGTGEAVLVSLLRPWFAP